MPRSIIKEWPIKTKIMIIGIKRSYIYIYCLPRNARRFIANPRNLLNTEKLDNNKLEKVSPVQVKYTIYNHDYSLPYQILKLLSNNHEFESSRITESLYYC